MTLEHLGSLHPLEHAMVLLLAFGPFVVLAVVMTVIRRREARDEAVASSVADEPPSS